MGPIDWLSRRAIVFRIWLSGTSVNGVEAERKLSLRLGSGDAGETRVAPAGAGAAASRSRATIRPSGPVPNTPPRSSPRSAAMRRASGDALTRPGACEGAGSTLRVGARRGSAPLLSSAARAGGAGGIEVGWFRLGAGWVAWASRSFFGLPSALPAGFPDCAPSTASPGSPMTATGSETGTVAPASTMCLSSVPPARATNSMTALSVSTSANTSPTATGSPSCFFHSTRRPSSMVGERASITTLVVIHDSGLGLWTWTRDLLSIQHLVHRGDDLRWVGFGRFIQLLVVGHGYVCAGNPYNGRIQLIEGFPLDRVHHLRSDSGERPAFLHHDAAMGLGH